MSVVRLQNGTIDITGQRFKKLVVQRKCDAPEGTAQRQRNVAWWWCKCDCGNEVPKIGYNLRRGNTGSCGCLATSAGIIAGYEERRGFDQQLRTSIETMIKQGMSNWDISVELNVGLRAISRARGAMKFERYTTAGVPVRMRGEFPWNAEREMELLSLRESGKSTPAIGKHFGISRSAVVGKLKRLEAPKTDIEPKFKRHPNRDKAETMIRNGHRSAEIARACKMSKDTVYALREKIDPLGNFKPAFKKPARLSDAPIHARSRQTLEPRQTALTFIFGSLDKPRVEREPVDVVERRPILHTTFKERTKRQCEWVEEAGKRWNYCEEMGIAGKPYCHEHCMKAFPRYASAARTIEQLADAA